MRVLVTGSSGFIGGHLAKALVYAGHEVYATEHINPIPVGIPLECDLRKPSDVMNVVYESQPEVVFHLASQPIVTKGEKAIRYTYECNVDGSFNLLEELRQHRGLKLFINASSDKVYGRNMLPYDEDLPLLGNRQMYETTKTMQDHLTQYYSTFFPTVITRCSNVYGPNDNHESRIVPHTINQYLHGEYPIIRSNGQQYRDYMYVDDCVAAYLACMEYGLGMEEKLNIFNFGSSNPVRVLDLVSMIREHFPNSKDPQVEYGARDEIPRQWVTYDKAFQHFGWFPQVNLRDGIERTVNWWKEVYDAE
jgi:CDP-glucose 4,6-dehydratase